MQTGKINSLVSVILLTWNSEDFISLCLESLAQQTYPYFEIIVVDNASKDNTVQRLKACAHAALVKKLIVNEKNLGCAGGNNVGWRASSGDIVIFLNPDTVVTKTWMENLSSALLADREAVIAGCRIHYPNSHRIQHAGGILYPNGMSRHVGSGEEDQGQYDQLRQVDYVTGAAIGVKRDFLEKAGGFDEDYFPAYFEETDLCYKAKKQGKRALYVPNALLYHYESPGLSRHSPQFYALYYKMRIRFVVKNYTLLEILIKFLPFELRWMLFEPLARGFRLRQLRAYWQGIKFVLFHRR